MNMVEHPIIRFAVKTIVFMTILVIVSRLLGDFGHGIASNGYFSRVDRMLFNLETASEYNVIRIGNSHSTSLDPELLGKQEVDLWLGGSDIIYAYEQLETLLPKFGNVEEIYVPISYFTLFSRNQEGQNFGREVACYTFLLKFQQKPKASTIQNCISGFVKRNIGVLRRDNWTFVVSALLQPRPRVDNTSISVEQPSHSEGEIRCNSPSMESVERVSLIESRMQVAGLQSAYEKDPTLSQETLDTLIRMIDTAKTQGTRIIFFTPPYYRAYTDNFDPMFVEDMRHKMQLLQLEDGVEYYDFSDYEVFAADHRYFSDGHHLTGCGIVEFTEVFGRVSAENR